MRSDFNIQMSVKTVIRKMAYNALWKCLWIHWATSPWPSHLVQSTELRDTRNPLRHTRLVNWHIHTSAILHELLRKSKFNRLFQTNSAVLTSYRETNLDSDRTYSSCTTNTTVERTLRNRANEKLLLTAPRFLRTTLKNIFGWRAEYVDSYIGT